MSYAQHMEAAACECLTQALMQSGGNRAAAARALKLNRTHFFWLLKRYHVLELRAESVTLDARVAMHPGPHRAQL